MNSNIYIGADHAGFALKQQVLNNLSKKYKFVDLTPDYIEGDDYPDVAEKVAKRVAKEKARAILVCGSAEGMCIAANKIKTIRAIVAFNEAVAQLTRKHDDANILCLSGGQFLDANARKLLKPMPVQTAVNIVDTFLSTAFGGEERHARRIAKIAALEK